MPLYINENIIRLFSDCVDCNLKKKEEKRRSLTSAKEIEYWNSSVSHSRGHLI